MQRPSPTRSRAGLLVAVVFLTSLAVVPSAHAQIRAKVFTGTFSITRNGHRYDVKLKANRLSSQAAIAVLIRDERKPDPGTHVASRIAWLRQVGAAGFNASDDLKTGHLSPSGPEMGALGKINLTWTPTSHLGSCSGLWRARLGHMDGSFRFETDVPGFGVIKRSRIWGRFKEEDFSCSGRATATTPCSPSYAELYASSDSDVYVTKTEGVIGARFQVITVESLANQWRFVRRLDGRTSKEHLTVADDASSGEFTTESVPWLDGTLSYTETHAEPSTTQACGGNEENVTSSSNGDFAGDLTAHFLKGSKAVGGGATGFAQRTIRRPASTP